MISFSSFFFLMASSGMTHASENPQTGDAFSGDIRMEHIALIAPAGAILLCALCYVVIVEKLLRGRKLALPVFMLLLVFGSMFTMGVVAWGVTYTTSRHEIEEVTERFLYSKSQTAVSRVVSEIEPLILSVLSFVEVSAAGRGFDETSTWPDSQLFLDHILRPHTSSSVFMIYYALPDGRMYGVVPGRSGPLLHKVCVHPEDPLPSWVMCARKDYISEESCAALNCANQTARRDCAEHCNIPTATPSREHCYGTNASLRYLTFETTPNTTHTDTTSSSHSFLPTNNLIGEAKKYDPRLRPWYISAEETDSLTWQIYPFMSISGTGLTASRRILHRGELAMVVAVDFTPAQISVIMKAIIPTQGALSVLMTEDLLLLGSSLSSEELMADAFPADPSHPILSFGEDSEVRRFVQHVTERFGSVSAALETEAMWKVGSDDVVMALPVRLAGWCVLLGAHLPYADMMGTVDESSTMSLGLTLAFSVVGAAATFLVLRFALLPIQHLRVAMQHVAVMQTEKVEPCADSFLQDISTMQHSFAKMIENLQLFKEYIPQSVIFCGNETEDPPKETEVKKRRSTCTPVPSPAGSVGAASGSGTPPRNPLRRDSKTSDSLAISVDKRDDGSYFSHTSFVSQGEDEDSFPSQASLGSRKSVVVLRGTSLMLLKVKKISLASANIQGFQNMARTLSCENLSRLHENYLLQFQIAAKERKGIIEEFSGDQVTVSFNGVHTLSDHNRKCVAYCRHLQLVFSTTTFEEVEARELKVNFAAVCGRVLCGSMGCIGLKRFSIIGPVVSDLRVFERWGASWNIAFICGDGVAEDFSVCVHYNFRMIARAMCREIRPRRVYECMSECEEEVKSEEWMYQLDHMQHSSAWGMYNAVIDALYRGNFPQGAEALAKLEKTGSDTRYLRRWLETSKKEGNSAKPLFLRTVAVPYTVGNTFRSEEETNVLACLPVVLGDAEDV